MSGWLVLKLSSGETFSVQTPGETFIDIAKDGYPRRFSFTRNGLLEVRWTDVDPATEEPAIAKGSV